MEQIDIRFIYRTKAYAALYSLLLIAFGRVNQRLHGPSFFRMPARQHQRELKKSDHKTFTCK